MNSPGGDVDVVAIVPHHVERRHFFGELVDALRRVECVTNMMPVPSARVPLVAFSWLGVPVDLLYARLPVSTLPPRLNLLDDLVLAGLDGGSMLSLNAVRVTELVAQLVPHFRHFAITLRAVRHWFKQRGLYSNKLGFLGGVNFNILVAFVCRLYVERWPACVVCSAHLRCRRLLRSR